MVNYLEIIDISNKFIIQINEISINFSITPIIRPK